MMPELNSSLQKVLDFDWSLWMVVVITIIISLESIGFLIMRRKFDPLENTSSVVVGLGYFVINVLVAKLATYGLSIYIYLQMRLFEIPIDAWWSWALLLGLGDFIYYWIHRMEHESGFFWSTHENHHSASQYSFATAIRMPWGEIIYKPWIALWQPFLGFHPVMYPIIDTFNLTMGLLQHTELVGKLGWLEKYFATPSNHRVHHGTEPEYLDKNYGARLIIWDRMFGTYQPETVNPTYGLVGKSVSRNPLAVVTHGYRHLFHCMRQAESWRRRIQFLYRGPSWRP
jgi:sterol desaturase/sphingolipid hydroxylase (fatty acid hydroxylase superfamily)